MNKQIEDLKVVRSIIYDLAQNKDMSSRIRVMSEQFEDVINQEIKQLECPHTHLKTVDWKVHNDVYSFTNCIDCSKLIDSKRIK